MRIVSERIRLEDGSINRCQKDMRRLLNLNYLSLTNKTLSVGEYDFPVLYCSTDIVPDYLALYNQPGSYHRTALTGICFYIYDNTFDGMHGLFNAIYYHDNELLSYYKERFRDVRFIFSPDYSQFGDLQRVENESSVSTVYSSYGNKQSAIAGASSYPPAIASSAKKFFKGSSNAYNNYSITKEPDGSYHFIMEKPGNVPGSKAVYHKIVDSNGKTVSVYKDTFDPQGNLVHRKDK